MTSLKRPVRAASSATAPECRGIPAGSSSRAKGPYLNLSSDFRIKRLETREGKVDAHRKRSAKR